MNPAQIAVIKRDGIPFGKWTRFRNLYRWNLTAAEEINLSIKHKDIPVIFINGECLEVGRLLSEDFGGAQSPLPRNITFGVIKNNLPYPYAFHFDDLEIMEAFEKLCANGELVHLEVIPAVTREATTVRPYNDKESIPLTKTRVAGK
ncbi:MAG TPA: hypothetical protein PK129_04485 [Cellvibrionaceae bacterium]|nr:hypothetical protein [Cellvibrionaceae bacterium]